MKNYYGLLLGFLVIASLAFCTAPTDKSSNGIIAWVEANGGIASGTAIPTAVASEGAFYVDIATPTVPVLYRYTNGAWAMMSGVGVGGGDSASVTQHIAKTTDPHGADEVITNSLTMGTNPDASIKRSATGTVMIASYVAVPAETAPPIPASNAATLWYDGASLKVSDGTNWHEIWSALPAITLSLMHMNGNFTETGVVSAWTGAAVATTTAYKFGSGSGYFTGGSFLENTDTRFNPTSAETFTVDFWINFALTPTYGMFLAGNSDQLTGWDIMTNTAGQVVTHGLNGTRTEQMAAGADLGIGVWHHIELDVGLTQCQLFVDGVSHGTCARGTISAPTTGKYMHIGYQSSTNWPPDYGYGTNLVGHIDEFRFSQNIIRHTSGFTPPVAEY